jgi:hypothetical protein
MKLKLFAIVLFLFICIDVVAGASFGESQVNLVESDYTFISKDNKVYAFEDGILKWTFYDEASILAIAEFNDLTNDGVKELLVVSKAIIMPSIKVLDGKKGNIVRENNEFLEGIENKIPLIPTDAVFYNDKVYILISKGIYVYSPSDRLLHLFDIDFVANSMMVNSDGITLANYRYIYNYSLEGHLKKSKEAEDTGRGSSEFCADLEYTFDLSRKELKVNNNLFSSDITGAYCKNENFFYTDVNNSFYLYGTGKLYSLDKDIYNFDIIDKDRLVVLNDDKLQLLDKGNKIINNSFKSNSVSNTFNMQKEWPFSYSYNGSLYNLENLPANMRISNVETYKSGIKEYAIIFPENFDLNKSVFVLNLKTKNVDKVNFVPSDEELEEIIENLDNNISYLENKIAIKESAISSNTVERDELNAEINSKQNEINTLQNERSVQYSLRDAKMAAGLDYNAENNRIAAIDNEIDDLQDEVDELREDVSNLSGNENLWNEISVLRDEKRNFENERSRYDTENEYWYRSFLINLSTFCNKKLFLRLGNEEFYTYDLESKKKTKFGLLEEIFNEKYVNELSCLKKSLTKENLVLAFDENISVFDLDKNKISWSKEIDNLESNRLDKISNKKYLFVNGDNKLFVYDYTGALVKTKVGNFYNFFENDGMILIYDHSGQVISISDDVFDLEFEERNFKDQLIYYDCDNDNKKDILWVKLNFEDKKMYLHCKNKNLNQKTVLKEFSEQMFSNVDELINAKIVGPYLVFQMPETGEARLVQTNTYSVVDLETKKILFETISIPEFKDNKLYLNNVPLENVNNVRSGLISEIRNNNVGGIIHFNSNVPNRKLVYFRSESNKRSGSYKFYDLALGSKLDLEFLKGNYVVYVAAYKDGYYLIQEETINSNYSPSVSFISIVLFIILLGIFLAWEVILWKRK